MVPSLPWSLTPQQQVVGGGKDFDVAVTGKALQGYVVLLL